ncbi:MAG: hypothetical protein U9Q76_05720, partial [candidate division WOR-3 bacterium]|nr:hypothetical protein [candidate division WOR-3 bacterium]
YLWQGETIITYRTENGVLYLNGSPVGVDLGKVRLSRIPDSTVIRYLNHEIHHFLAKVQIGKIVRSQ